MEDKIGEIVMQSDYFIKQSLIGNGHSYAMTKALSGFSAEAALREALEPLFLRRHGDRRISAMAAMFAISSKKQKWRRPPGC